MKIVLQRVSRASVKVDTEIVGKINQGLLLLVGFTKEESTENMEKWIQKIIKMRIFNDEEGKMNLSINQVMGDILIVSQFTLLASTKKGNRPSYIEAAPPEMAEKYYHEFLLLFENHFNKKIEKGIFGADMKVELLNDGPVTILLDTL